MVFIWHKTLWLMLNSVLPVWLGHEVEITIECTLKHRTFVNGEYVSLIIIGYKNVFQMNSTRSLIFEGQGKDRRPPLTFYQCSVFSSLCGNQHCILFPPQWEIFWALVHPRLCCFLPGDFNDWGRNSDVKEIPFSNVQKCI